MGIHDSNCLVELSASEDEESPIRGIFCVKNKAADLAKIEQDEDCFILEFDPTEIQPISNQTPDFSDDDDLSLISAKGQVALRDYPHPRHLCAKFPFQKTPHESHCNMCFCYICDTKAPCKYWTQGVLLYKHCDAHKDENNTVWETLKKQYNKA